MDARGVALKELAEALNYEVRNKNGQNYIRYNYKGYFNSGTYCNVIIYKYNKEFRVYCYLNIKKAPHQFIVTERNGVKIVVEQIIEDAINSILSIKKN